KCIFPANNTLPNTKRKFLPWNSPQAGPCSWGTGLSSWPALRPAGTHRQRSFAAGQGFQLGIRPLPPSGRPGRKNQIKEVSPFLQGYYFGRIGNLLAELLLENEFWVGQKLLFELVIPPGSRD